MIRCHLGLSVKLAYDGQHRYTSGKYALVRTKASWCHYWTLHTRGENNEWAMCRDEDENTIQEEELQRALLRAGKALTVRFKTISEVNHG